MYHFPRFGHIYTLLHLIYCIRGKWNDESINKYLYSYVCLIILENKTPILQTIIRHKATLLEKVQYCCASLNVLIYCGNANSFWLQRSLKKGTQLSALDIILL